MEPGGHVLPAASTPRSPRRRDDPGSALTFTVEVLQKGGELPVPQQVGLGHPTAALPRRGHGASVAAAGSGEPSPKGLEAETGEGKQGAAKARERADARPKGFVDGVDLRGLSVRRSRGTYLRIPKKGETSPLKQQGSGSGATKTCDRRHEIQTATGWRMGSRRLRRRVHDTQSQRSSVSAAGSGVGLQSPESIAALRYIFATSPRSGPCTEELRAKAGSSDVCGRFKLLSFPAG